MRYKYPRTFHFPFSPGADKSDKILESLDAFEKPELQNVVTTIKMDGENTTLYHDYWHARSMTQNQHLSRNWLAAFHATIQHLIPPEIRICGENLYATHSIHYKNLPSYFQVFGIWEGDKCWSWEDTEQFCQDMKLDTVPVLSKGRWQGQTATYHWFESLLKTNFMEDDVEGIVVRLDKEIKLDEWPTQCAKMVRANHIQTDQHWMSKPVQKNGLKPKE